MTSILRQATLTLTSVLLACKGAAPPQAAVVDSTTAIAAMPTPFAPPQSLHATEGDSIPGVLIQFLDSITSPDQTNRTVLRLASFPGRYVISQRFRVPEGWMVYRLALVQVDGARARILSLGPALGDQEWLTPSVWEAPGRALVLADQGSEYSWGLQAYIVTESGLVRDTTFPEVAKIDQQDPMGGFSDNGLPYAQVSLASKRFRVAFGIDLVQDPGGRHMLTLCRAHADSIVFTESDSGWVRSGAVESPFPESSLTSACS